MGNVAAIDIGIVVLRCTLFDRNNDMFPYKVVKKRQKLIEESKVGSQTDGYIEGSEVSGI